MNTDTTWDYALINHEIGFYTNLIRIKKHQKGTNPELEYQLKIQKNKLNALGVNTDDYKYVE